LLRNRPRKNKHTTRETEELVKEQEKVATELDHAENTRLATDAQLEQTYVAALGARRSPHSSMVN